MKEDRGSLENVLDDFRLDKISMIVGKGLNLPSGFLANLNISNNFKQFLLLCTMGSPG